MSLVQRVQQELPSLIGTGPGAVTVSDGSTCELSIDFSQVDSLSCSLREMRISVPSLAASGMDQLEDWAHELSQRISYLLENIGPLEVDATNQQILIRSTPPDKTGHCTRFYEIMLAAHAGGNFSLRRYESQQGQPGRTAVDIHMTHEVLLKLVHDVVDSIP